MAATPPRGERCGGGDSATAPCAVASPAVGPPCEEGMFRKSTSGRWPLAVLRCVRQKPHTSALSGGENERGAAAAAHWTAVHGIPSSIAIEAERPSTAIRPERKSGGLSARDKDGAAVPHVQVSAAPLAVKSPLPLRFYP